MRGLRYSRRRFIAAAGVAALPLVGSDGDAATALPPSNDRNWLKRYHAASPGTLVDIGRGHGDGWVLAGTDADQSAGLLLGITADGRVQWRRRLETGRDGHLVAVTRTPEGYAVFGRTADADGWLAYLSNENGQPGSPRFAKPVDAWGSKPGYIHPHPDGGVVVAVMDDSPERAWTRVSAFDTDGSQRWRHEYGNEHSLAFLVPFDDGWLLGGSWGPAWLAALGPAGERRWQTTVGEGEAFDIIDGVPAGDGVTLAVHYYDNRAASQGLVHVGADRSIRWQRRYDGLKTHALVRTTDGGYAVAGQADDGDGIRLAKPGPNGSLRRSVTVAEERAGPHEVFDLVERAPNAYLLVGTHVPIAEPSGWALGLNDTEATVHTPTVTPPHTPKPPSPTASPTPTPTASPSASPPPTTPPATTTSAPGFSLPATGLSLGAAALLRAIRRKR